MRRLVALASTIALSSPVAAVALATPAEAAASLGQRAVSEAARHERAPYSYGAAGPSRFDCSGLTSYVYGRLGRTLPHSSASQYNASGVRHITRSQLAAGDLVFTIRDGKIRHVGIYAGGNEMWAATQSGDVVRKQSLSGRQLVFGHVS